MIRRLPLLLCRIAFISLITIAVYAQEGQARRSLFLAEFTREAAFNAEQQNVIQESLLLRLQNEVESVDFIIDASLEDVESLNVFQRAVINAADSVLLVRISGDMTELVADFILYDALVQSEVGRFSVSGSVDSQYRNLFAGFWYEAIVTLEETFQPLADSAELAVSALPGTLVSIPFATREGETVDEDLAESGRAVFNLPIPASYRVILQRPGYYTEERELFLNKSTVLDLREQQEPLDRWYVQPGLHMLSFARIGGGMLLREDRLRLGLDIIVYQLGIQPFQESSPDNREPSLIISLPLTTLGVSGAMTFPLIPWDLPIQPYAEAVLAMRFLTETRLIIDPLFPLELRLEPGIQWNIGRHSVLFVGLSNTFSFMTKRAFFDLIPDEDNGQYGKIAPWLYFSGFVPFMGVRFGI
jgi:hypothetical protein